MIVIVNTDIILNITVVTYTPSVTALKFGLNASFVFIRQHEKRLGLAVPYRE